MFCGGADLSEEKRISFGSFRRGADLFGEISLHFCRTLLAVLHGSTWMPEEQVGHADVGKGL